MMIHITQVVMVSNDAEVVEKTFIIILDKLLTVLMPIGVAYNNIVYGMTPHFGKSGPYTAPSSWQDNMILLAWLLVISAFIVRHIKRYESA